MCAPGQCATERRAEEEEEEEEESLSEYKSLQFQDAVSITARGGGCIMTDFSLDAHK